MKKRLLIPIACAAIFGFFAFQPLTLHPDIAAAKAWYEANVTSVYVPNWNDAELDVYPNGNMTIHLPVSNFSTYKWMDSNHPDTSQVNGATQIMIGKKPNEPYKAAFLKFDFFPSTLLSTGSIGLQSIRLIPALLGSMSFNGICYAQNMADTSQHGGWLFENGLPIKTVFRYNAQDLNSVVDRDCDASLYATQTTSLVSCPSCSTGSALYVSGWTWWISAIVCDNEFPQINWGNPSPLGGGLGQYWQYPWGLYDPWSTYPQGNTWNPPPSEPPSCNCKHSYFVRYWKNERPVLVEPWDDYWFNIYTNVGNANCNDGSYGSAIFSIEPAPGQSADIAMISTDVATPFHSYYHPPVKVKDCVWDVDLVIKGTLKFEVEYEVLGIAFVSKWSKHREAFPIYTFE